MEGSGALRLRPFPFAGNRYAGLAVIVLDRNDHFHGWSDHIFCGSHDLSVDPQFPPVQFRP